MASTKIINVLRTDSFEETLNEFNEASASEVIFVLPKSPRAFKKSDHFAALAAEASTQGKKATFLTNDPVLTDLALANGFDVLEARTSNRTQKSSASKPLRKTQTADDEQEIPIKHGVDEEIAEWFAAPAKVQEIIEEADSNIESEEGIEEIEEEKPVIKEIFTVDEEATPVRIAHQKEKPVLINVRSEKTIFPKGRVNFMPPAGQVRKWILPSLIVVTILVVGGIVVATTGSAKIEITPQKRPLDFQLKVTASDSVSAINTQSNRIPGQYIEISKQVSKEFRSSGQKDVAQKARGKITVHNETGSNQQLVTTTRFASPSGLIFRTLLPVVVPANGKVSVDVIADKSGSEYNLQASTFTIPAFKEKGDALKYQKIY